MVRCARAGELPRGPGGVGLMLRGYAEIGPRPRGPSTAWCSEGFKAETKNGDKT